MWHPYPIHICTNNKRNRNVELIKSFKTHLNKKYFKRVKGSHSLSEIIIELVQINDKIILAQNKAAHSEWEEVKLKTENIKQLYYSWNYNIWNETLCPDVTFIRAFPWHRLSLSISSMKLIICWFTWNKMTFNPNTNTHRKWVITFVYNRILEHVKHIILRAEFT